VSLTQRSVSPIGNTSKSVEPSRLYKAHVPLPGAVLALYSASESKTSFQTSTVAEETIESRNTSRNHCATPVPLMCTW